MDIKNLFKMCLKEKASDLHIAPGVPPILRINGEFSPIADMNPVSARDTEKLIYSVMCDHQIDALRQQLELDFSITVENIASFRANVFFQQHGLAGVFRLIPQSVPTLDELNMPEIIKNLLNLQNGLILITGPTGSGKSTTLAAMVNYINENEALHIVTIEDPIEFKHVSKNSLINQRQVNRDTHNFANALRASLRQDPDVMMLGEMRDLETIRLALTAAETGHLVLATLHTASAPKSITRIIDVFSAEEKHMIRNMLSESLQAVVCQTLVKNVNNSRTAALEIMIGTPAIRNLIREDKIAHIYTTIQTNRELGMCTLDQYLLELKYNNIITAKEAVQVALNKELFHEYN